MIDVSLNWMDEVVEECKNAFVETDFASRWALLEGYHKIGQTITESLSGGREETYGQEIVKRVAVSIKKSKRLVYLMKQFAETYPDLDLLPYGKNATWTKVVKELMPAKSDVALPALPDRDYMKDVITHNLDFLIDNLTQSKKGVSMFLPYDYIDSHLKKAIDII